MILSTSTSPPPPSTLQTSPSAFGETGYPSRTFTPQAEGSTFSLNKASFLQEPSASLLGDDQCYSIKPFSSVTKLAPINQLINNQVPDTPDFLCPLCQLFLNPGGRGKGCHSIWLQKVHTFLGGHSPLTLPSIKAPLNSNLSPFFVHNGNRPS